MVVPRKNKAERGKVLGAYVTYSVNNGPEKSKYMNGKDILAHGKKFSKSFNYADSPWKPENDPELNQWKKTVLIQAGKLMPKSEKASQAIHEDMRDGKMFERFNEVKDTKDSLSMGNFLKDGDNKNKEKDEKGKAPAPKKPAANSPKDEEERGAIEY